MINIGKHGDLRKKLEECGLEVETKKDVSHRICKTDFVVTMDFKNQYQEYQKINHLIILTKEKESHVVYQMATKLHTDDIIDESESVEYIAKRIKEVVEK